MADTDLLTPGSGDEAGPQDVTRRTWIEPDTYFPDSVTICHGAREMKASMSVPRADLRALAFDFLGAGEPEPDDREALVSVFHGDACPEDPDDGEWCGCHTGHYERLADLALATIRRHPEPVEPSEDEIARACGDPGSILPRIKGESVPRWSARAVLALWPGRSVAEGGGERG